MRLFLSTLKRFFVIFRKRPIFVSSIISFLLGIILFFIALFRNRLTHSFIFELNLLYPDWAVFLFLGWLVLIHFFWNDLFVRHEERAETPPIVPNPSPNKGQSAEQNAPLNPSQQLAHQQLSYAPEAMLPLPEFLVETCVTCGREVGVGNIQCSHCIRTYK